MFQVWPPMSDTVAKSNDHDNKFDHRFHNTDDLDKSNCKEGKIFSGVDLKENVRRIRDSTENCREEFFSK